LYLDLPDTYLHVRAVLDVNGLPLQQRVDLDVLHIAVRQPQEVPQQVRSTSARLIEGFQSSLEIVKRQQGLEHLGALYLSQVDRDALGVLDEQEGRLPVCLLVKVLLLPRHSIPLGLAIADLISPRL